MPPRLRCHQHRHSPSSSNITRVWPSLAGARAITLLQSLRHSKACCANSRKPQSELIAAFYQGDIAIKAGYGISDPHYQQLRQGMRINATAHPAPQHPQPRAPNPTGRIQTHTASISQPCSPHPPLSCSVWAPATVIIIVIIIILIGTNDLSKYCAEGWHVVSCKAAKEEQASSLPIHRSTHAPSTAHLRVSISAASD